MSPITKPDENDPVHWLGNTPMLNLDDDKLRLRVKSVIQLSATHEARMQSIARYVAAIPFNVPAFSGMKRTRRTLAERRAVGWYSKAALFMAMLRIIEIPARVRMIAVPPETFQGLARTNSIVELPVVEVWSQNRWVVTDSYLYDPSYLATARSHLAAEGRIMGYGIHRQGQCEWNGVDDALVMIVPEPSPNGWPKQYLGVYDDPQAFSDQLRHKSFLGWWLKLMRNRMLSIRMNQALQRLRRAAGG